MRNLGFIKENGLWYANLPEFLERGLGTRNNLLMVDGSDTFLDLLSNQGNRITLTMSEQDFEGCQGKLDKIDWGKNQSLLDSIGHAPVDYGAYYMVNELKGKPFQHRLWLCPVTEFIFGGLNPISREVHERLRVAYPGELDRTDLHKALGGHFKSAELSRALDELRRRGFATCRKELTGGAPCYLWRAVAN